MLLLLQEHLFIWQQSFNARYVFFSQNKTATTAYMVTYLIGQPPMLTLMVVEPTSPCVSGAQQFWAGS